MQECWQNSNPFIIGRHTQIICDEIDGAINRYRQGESSCIIIKCPFRHGKSDIVSRYLPPRFLGLFPDDEIMVATYAADLANDLSRDARHIIKSREYAKVFPAIRFSKESFSVENWQIAGHQGETHWAGIGGAQTGKGYNLGIIDDYLKNRQDAESQLIRDRQWNWFTNVFLTRRAPVSITIILATPWHMDDIIGRCEESMVKDKQFPQFKVVKLPAFSKDYPQGILFPERLGKSWYDSQRAALGTYGTASLLQCDPQAQEGRLFKTNKIKYITEDEIPDELLWVRAWDLASTEKELIKQDPDWTVGIKMCIDWERRENVDELIPHIYISNVKRMREEAPTRNKIMIETAKGDGAIPLAIEVVAGYKDTATQMQDLFEGIRQVTPITVSKDKLVRSAPLLPAFEAGNVSMVRGDWNQDFVSELNAFPSGKHDDQVDALSTGYEYLKNHADDKALDALGEIEIRVKE
jgi:predicted phage terminase large subunit-like protein